MKIVIRNRSFRMKKKFLMMKKINRLLFMIM